MNTRTRNQTWKKKLSVVVQIEHSGQQHAWGKRVSIKLILRSIWSWCQHHDWSTLKTRGACAQTSHKAVCSPGLPINPTKYSTAHATVSLRSVPLFYKISSLPGLFMGPSPPQDAPVPAGALEGLTHHTPSLSAAFCQPPSHSACAEVSYWAREQLASLRTQYFKVFCLLFIALWTGWAVQGEWLTTPLPVPPFAVIQHL